MSPSRRPSAIGRRTLRTVLAYGVFSVVEFAIWIAIILYAYAEGGVALAGLVGVVQLLPAAVLSPLVASAGDRLPRGRALVMGYLVMAVVTASVALALGSGAPTWAVVALSTVATTLVSAIRPVHYAALPGLARSSGELVGANAYSSVGEGVAAFVGPVVAGVLAQVAGPTAVFVGATVLCLLAATATLGLGLPAAGAAEEHPLRAAFAGLVQLRHDAPALSLLLVMAVGFVLAGALDVLGVAYALDVLDAGEAGAGVVLGAIGIGAVLGALVASAIVDRPRIVPVLLVAGVVEGAAVAVVAAVVSLPAAVALLATSGAASALVLVGGRTLLQRATDDRVMARVFAVQESTSLLGLALGALAVPLIVERVGVQQAFIPLGVASLGIVALGVILARRLDDRAVYPAEAIALLRRNGLLARAPQHALERMAREGIWRELAAEEVAVRQGDPGEEFFVVEQGRLAVDVDGVRRPHELGPDDGFGEIALLLDVPRTATITALEHSRCLVIDSAAFLAAVTGDEDVRRRAADTAGASPSEVERDRDPDLDPDPQ
jgi:MFS family permease